MGGGGNNLKICFAVVENFFKDKDIWIVGSMCLVASFLWCRFWRLLAYNKKRETRAPADIQATCKHVDHAVLDLNVNSLDSCGGFTDTFSQFVNGLPCI
ncbi:hypothetical protein AGIG_G14877 [Arapaima gigas]